MKGIVRKVYVLLIALGVFSCSSDESISNLDAAYYDLAYVELFDTDVIEWIGGIADYPDSIESELNFMVHQETLNNVFSADNNVLVISAKNPHKDLFYYITRNFNELEPNAEYQISFTYELLVEVLDENIDTFDSDLYLKAGGTPGKPDAQVETNYFGPGQDNVLLNYDKGEGDTDGNSTIFFTRHIQEKLSSATSILLQGETQNEIIIKTNADGEFWGVFGIDSKNDKELSFAFNTIIVFFKKI